jgi:hypothetical protein
MKRLREKYQEYKSYHIHNITSSCDTHSLIFGTEAQRLKWMLTQTHTHTHTKKHTHQKTHTYTHAITLSHTHKHTYIR